MDWKIRLWYQWSVLPESMKECAHMWNLKEFEKGDEESVIAWIIENKNSLYDYHITDGSKKLKVTLEAL